MFVRHILIDQLFASDRSDRHAGVCVRGLWECSNDEHVNG